MESGPSPASLPSVEPTPDPNQQLVMNLTSSMNAAPNDTVITLVDGKEIRILGQIQYNMTQYLDELARKYVRDQFTGQLAAGDTRMGVLLQKGSNGWTSSTYSVQATATAQNNIESIYAQMKDQFVQEHGDLSDEFFFVTFGDNPEPYDAASGESQLNQIFAQQGFSRPVVITATLRGGDNKGEKKKLVSVFQVQLALTKQ